MAFQKLKRLLGLAPKQEPSPVFVEAIDPLERAVIAEAWRSGKPCYGVRNPDGSITITKIEDDKRTTN